MNRFLYLPYEGTNEPAFVAETLEWCNERRAEAGLEPLGRLPLGQLRDPDSCPCGQATGLYVDRTTYAVNVSAWLEGRLKFLPHGVQKFVSAFDDGDLPQYEECVRR